MRGTDKHWAPCADDADHFTNMVGAPGSSPGLNLATLTHLHMQLDPSSYSGPIHSGLGEAQLTGSTPPTITITSESYDPASHQFTLTWTSTPGSTYTIRHTSSLASPFSDWSLHSGLRRRLNHNHRYCSRCDRRFPFRSKKNKRRHPKRTPKPAIHLLAGFLVSDWNSGYIDLVKPGTISGWRPWHVLSCCARSRPRGSKPVLVHYMPWYVASRTTPFGAGTGR